MKNPTKLTTKSMSAARSSNLMPSEIPKLPKRSHSTAAGKSRYPPKIRSDETARTPAAAATEIQEASAPSRRRNSAIAAAEASGINRTR